MGARTGRVAALQHKLDPTQTGQGTSQISATYSWATRWRTPHEPTRVLGSVQQIIRWALAFDDESSGSGTPVSPMPLKIFGV